MGVYLSQPNKEKHIAKGNGQGLSFCSAEMQGWRKNMEDAVIHQADIGNGNALFAVFDGHGGFQVSEYVRQVFVRELIALESYKNKNYQVALDEAFKKIDQLIESQAGQKELKKIRSSPNSSNATEESHHQQFIGSSIGCTANVVLITPECYIVGNAGDSRSSLCREGKALDLSADHKPESAEQENRIKKAGGVITMGRVNGGLNLTRSFGDFDYKRNKDLPYSEQMITCKPDVKKVERKKGADEFILIGCDGIWQRYVDNSQGLIDRAKELVKTKKDNETIVKDLLEELIAQDTNSGIGCDNMSVILIVFDK